MYGLWNEKIMEQMKRKMGDGLERKNEKAKETAYRPWKDEIMHAYLRTYHSFWLAEVVWQCVV